MTVANRLSLAGRTAFVTGAGAGLGRGVAIALAEAGAGVICADRDEAAAVATARTLGGDARALRLDVTDRAAVFAAIDQLVDRAGRLDVLCNIAGVASTGDRIEDMTDAAFNSVFDVNFRGTLFGCQAALPHMIGAGSGSIINMASSAIDRAIPGNASYSVSKAAVVMLSKVLANEAGADGVRVNVVAPGFIPTSLSLGANADAPARATSINRWAAESPLGRVGEPDDVAQQFLYLASDASSFVTGQILRANGGVTMPW